MVTGRWSFSICSMHKSASILLRVMESPTRESIRLDYDEASKCKRKIILQQLVLGKYYICIYNINRVRVVPHLEQPEDRKCV